MNMIRLEPRHRRQEPVHFAINVARTAEINRRDHFYDIDDPSNCPSSSSWVGPSRSRSIVTKPSKRASSIGANESLRSSSDNAEKSHEGSTAQSDGGIEEVARDSSSERWDSSPKSKGKGKARADPTVHVQVVPAITTHIRTSRSRERNGAMRTAQGPRRVTSVNLGHPKESRRRPRKLLKVLREQGFGFAVVILLGNIAVVVCAISYCEDFLLTENIGLLLQVCLVCRTSCKCSNFLLVRSCV